jgi:hypothetical protein
LRLELGLHVPVALGSSLLHLALALNLLHLSLDPLPLTRVRLPC